jgi:protease-4
LITNLYNQFINDIVAGRKEATQGKLTREKLLKLADGRVYSGEQAAKNGLIDENGDLYTALIYARQQGKLPEDAPVTSLSDGGGGLRSLLGASTQSTVENLSQSAGAAFAQGAMGQIKSEAKDLPTPTY